MKISNPSIFIEQETKYLLVQQKKKRIRFYAYNYYDEMAEERQRTDIGFWRLKKKK